ncbi:NAD-dependent epimerase/dehydratase family protein [Paenibacillus beijingensis]|uniref:NAD-dependent epimerase/dehydratase domain-containing protein n=1 Tax=Paenibacillus beijingensis TaxID=1126833 RepID=A0A0D5NJG3_9BACL|nr:NAD-dependent epimerase/dehydratase family protein [Paenibacillus beijingensis]AJY75078.1 hypothetical protein VN24_11430 [Paenibacillus beijingensis]
MKILITGGYGFIGSFVAERFHKEGDQVFILDNLSSGSKSNVPFKHRGYILNVEDRNCDEIFRAHRFDVVVHLAAQVSVATSMIQPELDAKSNVLGLANMLTLARKYGIKKFIFASSAAVYGAPDEVPIREDAALNPISPYGINKMVGEIYCEKWKDLFGLDTLCFRFSNVYGPKQGNGGEGGVVSIFIERVLAQKEIHVYGDGGQTRDFIYVEDVADAIYRASYSSLSGVFNLSTCTENRVTDLIKHLQQLHGAIDVSYSQPREGDIYRSALDNRRIFQSLDWVPKYSLQEGLRKTYDWFKQNHRADHAKPGEQAKTRVDLKNRLAKLAKLAKPLLPSLENLFCFAVLLWITLKLQPVSSYSFDYSLLYILLIGLLHGSRQSMPATVLAFGLYIYRELESGRDLIALTYSSEFFFQLAVYLSAGLVVGYSIDHRTRKLRSQEEKLLEAEEKYSFLHHIFDETRLIKDELQQQILTNGHSFGKLHAVTKELETLEPEQIFTAAVGVLESIMNTDSVTIHTVNKQGNFLRLAAHSSGMTDVAKSVKVQDYPYLNELLVSHQLFVNKDLKADLPLLAAPVISAGQTVALVSVHTIEFERFTLYYQNLFKVAVDLISSALTRAHSYIEAVGTIRYVDGMQGKVLRHEVFAEIVINKQKASSRYGLDFILLTSLADGSSTDELADRIVASLRETDYMGMGRNGELLVLLSNTNKEEAQFVLERFQKQNIYMKVVEEGPEYV